MVGWCGRLGWFRYLLWHLLHLLGLHLLHLLGLLHLHLHLLQLLGGELALLHHLLHKLLLHQHLLLQQLLLVHSLCLPLGHHLLLLQLSTCGGWDRCWCDGRSRARSRARPTIDAGRR